MDFQDVCAAWANTTFGNDVVDNVSERSLRMAEEALELAQAMGSTREQMHTLVDHVYNRKVGTIEQEIGGVMVTLAVLCACMDTRMEKCGDREILRCMRNSEKIRLKQHTKPPAIRAASYPNPAPEQYG